MRFDGTHPLGRRAGPVPAGYTTKWRWRGAGGGSRRVAPRHIIAQALEDMERMAGVLDCGVMDLGRLTIPIQEPQGKGREAQ